MSEQLYEVFGLRLALPLPHRLLTPAMSGGAADVIVRLHNVPASLSDVLAEREQPLMQARVAIDSAAQVLWTTQYARFLVSDGRRIDVELLDPGIRPGAWLRFVLSNCLPAVLIQRGQLALHANAVATATGAVVIGGASGAGKSTLLAALIAAGNRMLSDDVTALRVVDSPLGMSSRASERVWVAAGFPQYRLCGDALDQLAPAGNVHALGGARGKFAVSPPASGFQTHAAPLRAIYLIEHRPCSELQVETLHGVDKLAALRALSYAPMSLVHLPRQWGALLQIAAATTLYRVRRPQGRWTVDALVTLVTGQQGRHEARIGA